MKHSRSLLLFLIVALFASVLGTGSEVTPVSANGASQAPTLLSPALGNSFRIGSDSFIVDYTLPALPVSGSVTIRWTLSTESTTYRELVMHDSVGTWNTGAFNPLDADNAMTSLNNVVQWVTKIGGNISIGRLPAGEYDFRLTTKNASDSSIVTTTTSGVNLRVRCDAGYFSTDGYTPCAPATSGHFASADGTANVECPVGEYQPSIGSSSCIPAEIGFYVSETGATEPLACPAGSTTTTVGQSSCTLIETEDSSTTSTSSTSTSVPQSTSTSSTSTTPITTTTITMPSTTTTTTSIAVPIVIAAAPKACTAKKSRNISRSCLVQNAKITVAASSKVVIKVAAASKKVCTLKGTVLKALKKGTCSTTLTVTPKGKKSKTYRARVIVIS